MLQSITITPLIQNVAMDYIRNYSLLQHWLLIRLDMSVSFDIAFYACKWWRPKKAPPTFFWLHLFFVLWDRRQDATCLVAMWEVQEQSLSTGYSIYAKLIGIWVHGKSIHNHPCIICFYRHFSVPIELHPIASVTISLVKKERQLDVANMLFSTL